MVFFPLFVLCIIWCLFYYLILSPTLPPLSPLFVLLREYVKENGQTKMLIAMKDQRNWKRFMHILFVIIFVNSSYSVMFLCVYKFESFSTLYWTERWHMSARVMTRLPLLWMRICCSGHVVYLCICNCYKSWYWAAFLRTGGTGSIFQLPSHQK